MIGFFDSGFGGLTVLKEVRKKLPEYDYVYLGDNARVPYGNRSHDTVYEFTKQAVDYLFKRGCKLIIIACNTASSVALRRVQQEYLPLNYPNRRVLGVIRPIVEEVTKRNGIKRIGVIATKGTVSSNAYVKEFKKFAPEIEIIQQSAPLLVPLIEEGWDKNSITKKVLKKYLTPLKQKGVRILIPGCTHYPLLEKQVKRIMGKNCEVLGVGEIVADSLSNYLKKHEDMEVEFGKNFKIEFLTTDDSDSFNHLGSRFWGMAIKSQRIDLG